LRGQYFAPQLETTDPDLVIFGIGINDAYMPEDRFSQEEFENNYRELIRIFRNVNPNVQFIFMTNNDSYYKGLYPNANALKVQKAMKTLAAEYGGAYWDLFGIMGGLNSVKMWNNEGLAKNDLVHFTPAGYVLQADMLFKAISDAYGEYLKKTKTKTKENNKT
jgi:lysophospholipase L1-like esterase